MSTLDRAVQFPGLALTLPSFGPLGVLGGMSAGGAVSAAWPVASTAYFMPVRLPLERTLVAFAVESSTPISGNFDIGLYTPAWLRIASAGSTLQTPANSIQKVILGTPLTLPPGTYYLAMVVDNTTGIYIRSNAGATMGPDFHRALGMAEQASAFPLPPTATPGPISVLHLPWCGLVFAGAPL